MKSLLCVSCALIACFLIAEQTLAHAPTFGRIWDKIHPNKLTTTTNRDIYAEVNEELCKRISRSQEVGAILRGARLWLQQVETKFAREPTSNKHKKSKLLSIMVALNELLDLERAIQGETFCTHLGAEKFELFVEKLSESRASNGSDSLVANKCQHLNLLRDYLEHLRVNKCAPGYLEDFRRTRGYLPQMIGERVGQVTGAALNSYGRGQNNVDGVVFLHKKLISETDAKEDDELGKIEKQNLIKSLGNYIRSIVKSKQEVAAAASNKLSHLEQVEIFDKYLLFPCESCNLRFNNIFRQANIDSRLIGNIELQVEFRELVNGDDEHENKEFIQSWYEFEMCHWIRGNAKEIKEYILV